MTGFNDIVRSRIDLHRVRTDPLDLNVANVGCLWILHHNPAASQGKMHLSAFEIKLKKVGLYLKMDDEKTQRDTLLIHRPVHPLPCSSGSISEHRLHLECGHALLIYAVHPLLSTRPATPVTTRFRCARKIREVFQKRRVGLANYRVYG